MFRTSYLVFSSIRPSTLRVRVPRVGFCDDSKNVNKSLRNIRRQLGPLAMFGRPSQIIQHSDSHEEYSKTLENETSKGSDVSDYVSNNDFNFNSLQTHDLNTKTKLTTFDKTKNTDSKYRISIDTKNKFHKSLWVSMKKRDSLSFNRICQQLRKSGLELDSVSYTLMINGTLMFSKSDQMDQVVNMIEEMKQLGLHPSLIRFLSRLISLYLEMCYYNSRPLISNWLSVTRSSWLTAYLINNKYKSQ